MKKLKLYSILLVSALLFLAEAIQAQNPTRKILLEEFTGAWCGLCPQGFVFMDSIKNNYDNIISVAIHQGDPMTFPAGNDVGMEYTGGGVPAFLVDRYLFNDYNFVSIGPDYALLSEKVEERFAMQANASVSITNVEFDETTNMAGVTLRADFYEDLNGKDLRFNLYVVEDNVSSPETSYNQSSFFAGIEGHPFEDLGGSISNFNHRYVCRSMAGGAWGAVNSIPSSNLKAGDSFQYTFQVPLADVWKKEDISFVALVQQYSDVESDRAVLNSEEITFDAAINATPTNNTDLQYKPTQILSVYPNPVTGNAKIELNLDKTALVKITVINEVGQEVAVLRNEYMNQGMHTVLWNTNNSKTALSSGIYFVAIETNGERTTKKITLVR